MTHPEQPVLAPGSIFAGYTIEGVVDRGGMGVVYRAQDPDLDRRVALKVIAPEHAQDPTAVARFKSEARLAASLEHPNIVAIHRGGELDGVLYLAMQFIPGTNLRRIIEHGTLDLPRIADITTQVASALDAAHARGLVHRDVKPGNILVTGEGDHEHVYLTDFGLTKRLGTGGDLTRPGGWVGTPDYVAPEQIQARDIDGRADVYSLGCVVYEMLTGEVAFPSGTDVAKLWAHVTDPPPLPRTRRPDLVEDFDALVARATAKDPQDRFPSAGALAAAVRDAVAAQEATREQGAMADTVGGDLFPPTVIGSASSAVPPAAAVPPAPVQPSPVAAVFPTASEPVEPPPPATPPPGAGGGPPGGSAGGDARTSRSRRGPLIAGLVFVVCAVAAVIVLTQGGSSGNDKAGTPAESGELASAALGAVPTNHVTGKGDVKVTLNGNTATVDLRTTGLVNAAHLMHIHAGAKGTCPDRSAAQRYDGHLAIGTHNGAPFYGPVVTSLTTKGSTSKNQLLNFADFPFTGTIDYKRKIDVGPVVAAEIRADNAVVVVHGIDYNGNNIYDNVLDRSDLNRRFTNESTAPAVCGSLVAKKSGDQTTAAVRSETYTASLVDAPENPAWQPIGDDPRQFLCHLGGVTTTTL